MAAARPGPTHRSTPVRVQEGRHGAAHVCGVIGQPRSPHRRETSSVNGLRSAVTDASIASESLVRHRRLLGSRAMQDEGQLLLVPRAPRTKYPAEPPLVYLGRTPGVILSAMLLPHGPCIPTTCSIQLDLVFSKPCTQPFQRRMSPVTSYRCSLIRQLPLDQPLKPTLLPSVRF